ncbi:MAG TPA: hypothetical protein VI757_16040 [Bacteroidia bacterium]|nr:hypothetical protein [Bacteroidia bacterium]
MALKSKEYKHAFFNVILEYDDSKPESDYEKELVKRYMDFLTQLQSKRELMKDLRNRYYHEQLMVDDAAPLLDELLKQYELLLPQTEEFRDGKNNDRDEYRSLCNEIVEGNKKYLQYHEDTVNKIRNIINDNEKYFDVLFNWFENDVEEEKAYSYFDDYAQELYGDYEKYSLSLTAYDRSVDDMKGEWQKLGKEWNELFAIREKTVALSRIYSDKIIGINSRSNALNQMMEQLSAGKFKPEKVLIEEIDSHCIQFRFLEKDMFSARETNVSKVDIKFRIDYDVEKIKENEWIFDMDNYVLAEQEMFMHIRTSFRIPMTKKYMFKTETLTFLMDKGLQNAFECADEYYKKEKKKLDWTKFKVPEEAREFLIKNLVERTSRFDDSEEERMGYYNFSTMLDKNILTGGTVLILNEVLFYNPAFNWDKNQKSFGERIPVHKYVTLRCFIDAAKKKPQRINVGQLLCFMLCIDCASQLLTGEHLAALEPRLNECKFDENIRKEYLKEAQQFIKDILDQMKAKDGKFVDLEEDQCDWNSMIN